jgi:hypothetical protein
MAKLIKFSMAFAMVTTLLGATIASSQDATKPQPRVVNVTSDSTPGWLPSIEQSAAAEKTAREYLAAEDSGRAQDAYRYLHDLDKRGQPFDVYDANLKKFDAQAGQVTERRIVKVTWTKDPQQAPLPGVYAAIDLASRFANIDRHCGYLVVYQPDAGGEFQVMREESNFIDNASAAQMEQQHGRGSVDQMWAQLSRNCPNYSQTVPTP